MTTVLIVFSWVLSITSGICTLVFLLLTIYESLMGLDAVEKLLKDNHFPLSYLQIGTIGFFPIGFLIVANVVRAKLLGYL